MAASPALELLNTRKLQLEAELEKYEKTVGVACSEVMHACQGERRLAPAHMHPLSVQVYQLETEYLGAEYSQCGTVLKVHAHPACACPALMFVLMVQMVNIHPRVLSTH